ncbi:Fc.00g002600.m01.CDS01 [Cosmosporella sp. VM-42]
MSLDELKSIYFAYKNETNQVANWIASKAAECGAYIGASPPQPAASGPSRRLKGKQRKEAKKAEDGKKAQAEAGNVKKYHITINEWQRYAETIVAARKPVPRWVLEMLGRVISGRTTYSEKLEELGFPPDDVSDDGHYHFVQVLVKVRNTLRQREERAKTAASSAKNRIDDASSRFDRLRVHEPSEEFSNAPDVQRPSQVKYDGVEYEAELPATKMDAIVEYNLMLDELNNIRSFVKDLWKNFIEEWHSLPVTSLTTNTSLDLARDIMKSSCLVFDQHGGPFTVARWAFYIETHKEEADPKLPWDITESELSEEVKSGMKEHYDIAERMIAFPSTFIETMATNNDIKAGAGYDPYIDRSTMTSPDKKAEDEELLGDYLYWSAALLSKVKEFTVWDEFLTGIFDSGSGTPVFYLAFASQVFLDVNHAVREKPNYHYKEFKKEYKDILESLEWLIETHHGTVNKPPRAPEVEEALKGAINHMEVIRADPLRQVFQANPGAPVPEKDHIFKRSPVLCGLALFNYRSLAQKSGIAMVNLYASVQCMAHLYNAAAQEGLITQPWGDLMQVQNYDLGEKNVYLGKSPRSIGTYPKNFFYSMGVSTAVVVNGYLRNSQNSRSRKFLEGDTPIMKKFQDRYSGVDVRKDWTTDQIATILEETKFLERAQSLEEGDFVLLFPDHKKFGGKKRKKKDDYDVKGKGKAKKRKETKETEEAIPRFVSVPDEPAIHQLLRSFLLQAQHDCSKFGANIAIAHVESWSCLRVVFHACRELIKETCNKEFLISPSNHGHLAFAAVSAVMWNLHSRQGSQPDERLLHKAAEAINGYIGAGNGNIVPKLATPPSSRASSNESSPVKGASSGAVASGGGSSSQAASGHVSSSRTDIEFEPEDVLAMWRLVE